MYHISRAIYRELAEEILESDSGNGGMGQPPARAGSLRGHRRAPGHRSPLLRAAGADAVQRHRVYFPMSSQERVCCVVRRYVAAADDWLAPMPHNGFDANGNPLQCRATTRNGTPCQRMPLPHNGYCPSHQHLAETEETEVEKIAA